MAQDLELIRTFIAAAETLSFTRAAERLGVSQPRLSLLIRRLEDQLGFRLFARAHRRVELTREGELMFAKAKALDAVLQEMDELVSELRREGRYRLRLGSPRYTLEIPERLQFVEDFNAARPAIRIEVDSDRTAPLLQRLRSGELDVVFATSPFDETDLETIPFARSNVFLAIPEEDPWAQREEVPIEAVAGKPFATYPGYIGQGYYRSWFGAFAEAGAKLYEAHDDHPTSLLRFAARRRYWTVAHPWPGQKLAIEEADRMVMRPVADAAKLGLGIAIRIARGSGPLTAAGEAFWSMAVERFDR